MDYNYISLALGLLLSISEILPFIKRIKGNGIELENVAIYPEYQGKSKGTALMGIFFLLLVLFYN